MNGKRDIITEDEFIADCDDRLRKLAEEVTGSGMTIYEIAKAARLSWKTVKHVADGIPVRWDTAARILHVVAVMRGKPSIGN